MANELPPLNPEQRRQVFEEERARLLALPASLPAPAPAAGTVTLSKGMIISLSVIGVLLVGVAVTHAFHSRFDDGREGSMHGGMGWQDDADECPMMQQQRGAQKETRMRRMDGDGMMRRDGSGQGQGGEMWREQSDDQARPMMLERHFQMQDQPLQVPSQHQMPDGSWMTDGGNVQTQ